jgi:hypothetical protein
MSRLIRRRNHNAARLAPATQAQRVFDGLPALAGVCGARPVLAPEQPLDQPLDVGRLAQPQQVAQVSLLAHVDDVFVAVAAVTSDECRSPLAEFIEQSRHRGLRVARTMLLARAEHGVEHQTQVPHPEGVQHVAGAPGLVRVVANLRTLLAAVQRLDGGIHVQHPRPVQGFAHAAHKRTAHPRLTGLGRHCRQRAAREIRPPPKLPRDTPPCSSPNSVDRKLEISAGRTNFLARKASKCYN